jgi:hypothetical protein
MTKYIFITLLTISIAIIIVLIIKGKNGNREGYTGSAQYYKKYRNLDNSKGLNRILNMNDNCECGYNCKTKKCNDCNSSCNCK